MTPIHFHQLVQQSDLAAVTAALDDDPQLAHRPAPFTHAWGDEQWLPLHQAAHRGDAAMVKLLLERGANPDARTRFHDPMLARATALHLAAPGGAPGNTDRATDFVEVVRLLLTHGAFVNPIDAHGYTPLTLARQAGCAAIAQLLEHAGAGA